MTQPTPATQPEPQPHTVFPNTHTINLHGIAAYLETLAFLVAVILKVLGHGNDAVITALSGAVMHAYNH